VTLRRKLQDHVEIASPAVAHFRGNMIVRNMKAIRKSGEPMTPVFGYTRRIPPSGNDRSGGMGKRKEEHHATV
jgi:hypothetical protein